MRGSMGIARITGGEPEGLLVSAGGWLLRLGWRFLWRLLSALGLLFGRRLLFGGFTPADQEGEPGINGDLGVAVEQAGFNRDQIDGARHAECEARLDEVAESAAGVEKEIR